MTRDEAKIIISSTFSNEFNENEFQNFIVNLLKKYDSVEKIKEGQFIKESFRSFIIKYKIIGYFEDSKKNKIDILEVALNKNTSLDRARTAQRNFVADYLKTNNKHAALVAFVSPGNKDWRLSLVKLEHSLNVVNDILKTKEEITPAKRWSFLVGINEGSHTAKSRFVDLLTSDENPNLSELELAFDIETVTDDFFNKYTELFFKFKESVDKLLEKDKNIQNDFKEKEITTVDFAKKTLGQIVFLYFLQKKGWFGVAPDKNWGDGPKKFIRELFQRREKYGSNFFNDILEPLFYEALAQDRGKESIYPRLNNCRMPFLNGGLFEPMNGYKWETTDMFIPDELFSNENKTKEGDTGDGILDVFDRYNFTVNENEPLEKEVAVDPEMLGKVFENLLDIKDRKSKGAFYTPREIVHYMCKESLISYLETETKNSIPREDLEIFIRAGDRIIENDKIALEKKKEKEEKGYEYKGKYELLLPNSIREKAKILDQLLKDVKVADPAVGSGAFPLGMINEIVRARKVLNVYLNTNLSDYQLKLHTISHSIYGVDIDPGAVEIAKLRLWLSLVVDEKTPYPLPNLEHKIMQGNSLISEYEDIKLFDDSILDDIQSIENEKEDINKKLSILQKEYLDLYNKGELSSVRKAEIEQESKLYQKRLKSILEKDGVPEENGKLFGVSENKKFAQEKAQILQKKIEEYISESQRSRKQNLKEEIDNLKWELIETTLKEQGKLDKIEEIKKLRKKNIHPFFIWKLEFSEVFKNNGGFSIVIGNPPYIQLQNKEKIPLETQKEYERVGFQTFTKRGDIYCLFYEFGNQLLKNNGHLVYITSNKWMRAGYGEKLRKYLSENTSPKLLIDLGSGIFKTATVDTNILLFQKGKIDVSCVACDIKKNLTKENIRLEDYIKNNIIRLDKFSSNAWIILNPIEQKIKEKIEKIGVPLKDWEVKINYGIKTGFNEAFIIDEKKKNELIANDPRSAEIIKPIIRGKDIKRYYTKFANKWIIIAKHDSHKFLEKKYPIIYNHLSKYKEELKKRGQCMNKDGEGQHHWLELDNNPNDDYLNQFDNGKVVYSEIVREPQFCFDINKYYPEATSFLMTGPNLKFLVSILNSKCFTYFFDRFYAGGGLGDTGYRYKKQFLELTPIPKISTEEQKPYIDLVDRILKITLQKNYDFMKPPQDQKELEKKIDEMVYKLYKIKDLEEIKLIENSSKR